jgi:SAM-dependent methyltransferase
VSYWRAAEFAFAGRQLNNPPGARVLDLGSPKDFAVFLALRRDYAVTAVDILPDAVAISERFARALRRSGPTPGYVLSEICDGRKLPYSDNAFDAVYSISVLEHIPDNGDSLAIAELVRVTKPGGRIVVTVPYDLQYRETFVDGPVYERDGNGRTFFERHYDETTLATRLLTVSGATVAALELWGEKGISVERIMARLGRGRVMLSPFEAVFAAGALRRVEHSTHRPMAAFFSLTKCA